MRNLIFILFVFTNAVIGQNPNTKVEGEINIKYLEHLIKVGVDEVRVSKGLKPLYNDSILYVAAKHHSAYLKKEQRIDHFEQIEKFKTPQNRVEAFGGDNYYVAENILFVPYGTYYKNKKGKERPSYTYQEVANNAVDGWVNSRPHYKNITNGSLMATGLGIDVDKEEKRVYVVQKFAFILFKYSFKANPALFPYSVTERKKALRSFNDVSVPPVKKYPHGLKGSSKSKSENLAIISQLSNATGLIKTELKGSSIYIKMNTRADQLLSILDGNKDGLAIEYINFIPFDCGNPEYFTKPSRRNGASKLSDTIFEPVYRKDLLKGFRPRRKSTFYNLKKEINKKDTTRSLFKRFIDGLSVPYYPDEFKVKLGKIPREGFGYYEFNLVYIKNKEIVYVQHFTGVCGEYYNEFNEVSMQNAFGTYVYHPDPKEEEVVFDFYFKKGQSKYSYADLKPVLKSINKPFLNVLKANIKAFSSVEGNESVNDEIQRERANSIVSAFEQKQNTTIPKKISTESNWALFEQQIDSNQNLAFLRGKTKLELQDTLKDKRLLATIEPYLAKQRKAEIKINFVFDLNDSTLLYYLNQEYKRLADSLAFFQRKIDETAEFKWSEKFDFTLDTLVGIQHLVYNSVKAGKLPPKAVNYFPTLSTPGTHDVFINKYFMVEDLGVEHKFEIEDLKRYTSDDEFHAIGAMNYLRLKILEWDSKNSFPGMKPEAVQKTLDRIGFYRPDLDSLVNALKINFWFKAAEHYFKEDKFNEKMEYLFRIYNFYAKQKIDENHAFKLAKFFVHLEYYEPAVEILKPYIETTKNEDLLVFYLKSTYYNSIEVGNNLYAQQLIKMRGRISAKNWCNMFTGECNISFQVFDDPELRSFYCSECANYPSKARKSLIQD